jgi:hypothetical protein
MPFVFMGEPCETLPVGELQEALGPFRRLDVGLLIHGNHHSVLRRVWVQGDNVGRFLRELRVGTDVLTPSPCARSCCFRKIAHTWLAETSPSACQDRPLGVARRRRLVELCQDA